MGLVMERGDSGRTVTVEAGVIEDADLTPPSMPPLAEALVAPSPSKGLEARVPVGDSMFEDTTVAPTFCRAFIAAARPAA